MKTAYRLLVPIAALLAAACGAGPAEPEFVEAAPKFDSMSMDVTGDPNEEGLGVASASAELGAEGAMVLHARWAAKLSNLHVRRVIKHVEHLLKSQPTEISGDTHIWLRQSENKKVEVRLTVIRVSEGNFTYTLEVRKDGEDDTSFSKVAEGTFTRGDAAGEGSGTITMSFEKLAGKDGEVKATGTLDVAFSRDGGKKEVTATWTRFKDDLAGATKEINGKYVFRKFLTSGNAAMRFSRDVSYSYLGADVDTSYRAVARWNKGVGGIGAAKLHIQSASGEKVWTSQECWSAGLGLTYRHVVKDDGAVEVTKTVGTPADCPLPADVPEPPLAEADAEASVSLSWPTQ